MSERLLPHQASVASFKSIDDPILEEEFSSVVSLANTSTANLSPPKFSGAGMRNRSSLAARTNRLSRQMSEQEFFNKHISEISSRDEEIRRLNTLVILVKSQASISQVKSIVQDYLNKEGRLDDSLASVQELVDKSEETRKQCTELEVIVNEQQERIEFLEALVEESDQKHQRASDSRDEERVRNEMMVKMVGQQEKIEVYTRMCGYSRM